MSNEGYHEPLDKLSVETMDMHRAITSLMEELEAVDWYNQRVDAVHDPDLKKILAHNRDCLLYTSPSPRDQRGSRMPSSA